MREVKTVKQRSERMLLIDSSILPDVFVKVLAAKKYLSTGQVKSASEAARLAGVSRSAFYKYRDYVFSDTRASTRMVTYAVTLKDEPGQLSRLIGVFPRCGANIVTVNQNIPTDGVALVTLSATVESEARAERLLERIKKQDGVVDVREIR